MARMIPPHYGTEAPPGEIRLFERLAADPRTEGWTVLHSLEIATHVRQAQGEADFVVISPEDGVAVIEVKSHKTIARDESGLWHLGRQTPTMRSPFKQGNEAMHSIKTFLENRGIDLTGIPIISAVWFTDVRARALLPENPEWHSWQVLDLDSFRIGAGVAVASLFASGRQHLAAKNPSYRKGRAIPHGQITRALRPKFEMARSGVDDANRRSEQLDHFLDEQFDALDAMEGNQSVLFTGPAGSGKTFLALEAVRRTPPHSRPLLVCFNRLLGEEIATRAAKSAPHAVVTSFHRLMLQISGCGVPDAPDSQFWEEVLVNRTIETLLEGGRTDIRSIGRRRGSRPLLRWLPGRLGSTC